MFAAFLIVVALLFLSLITRTYVRRWWHNRGSIDPHATERSRLLRARSDVEPLRGPHIGPPPGSTGGGGFG